MKLRDILPRLKVLGFKRVSQVGSHVKYRHANGRSLVVYMHERDGDLSLYAAHKIIDDARRKASAA
jgi:predicted RNA binding protein YcfA (HicA-like mRNA interferase family)